MNHAGPLLLVTGHAAGRCGARSSGLGGLVGGEDLVHELLMAVMAVMATGGEAGRGQVAADAEAEAEVEVEVDFHSRSRWAGGRWTERPCSQ